MVASTLPATAGIIFSEGFDDISALPGAGWVLTNNSSPAGDTNWFQGNAGVFAASDGPATSYIGANFLNAADGGDISNWLILPQVTVNDGDYLTFYTRSANSDFPDRLEVRFNATGTVNVGATASSVGDFGSSLLTINSGLAVGGYPGEWTQYIVTLSGLGGPANGRFAFRYNVSNTLVNADYIGIDSVSIAALDNVVPEPATAGTLLLTASAFALFAARRRKNNAN